MGKKKKKLKTTVGSVIEGEAEACFWRFICVLYKGESFHVGDEPDRGGNPDRLISRCRLNNHKNINFVWIDADIPISDESRKGLFLDWNIKEEDKEKFFYLPFSELQEVYNKSKRNPVLIVSTPKFGEELIFRILGGRVQREIRSSDAAKSALRGLLEGENVFNFCQKRLSKKEIEAKRKEFPQLDLLISMLGQ